MGREFQGIARIQRLSQDAREAAAFLDDISMENGSAEVEPPSAGQLERQPSQAAASLSQNAGLPHPAPQPPQAKPGIGPEQRPVSLSTLVSPATKKRLARAAHLQAAAEQTPCTQWEIVEAAIVRWCEDHGY